MKRAEHLYKCDRCGKFFVKSGKKIKIINNNIPNKCIKNKDYDLCNECTKDLFRWVNN